MNSAVRMCQCRRQKSGQKRHRATGSRPEEFTKVFRRLLHPVSKATPIIPPTKKGDSCAANTAWSAEWRKTALAKQAVMPNNHTMFAIGVIGLCAVLAGGWAAAYAENATWQSPNSTLTVPLPPATSTPVSIQPEPASSVAEPEFIDSALIERITQRVQAKISANKISPAKHRTLNPEDVALERTSEESTIREAKLPLADGIVARTIKRIGYPCGAVMSSIALKGEQPGTYKVTCTSGHSYQARPVHGRYHFKRM